MDRPAPPRSELEESQRALEIIGEVSRAFAEAGFDVQAIFETLARRVTDGVGDACAVRLLSADRTRFHTVAAAHKDPEIERLLRAITAGTEPAGEGASGEAARTGRAVLVAEVAPADHAARFEGLRREYLERSPVHSILAVPMIVRGEVLGVVAASRHAPGRPFGAVDQRLLQELADRAALAIKGARQHEELEVERGRMRRREEQAQFLADASKALGSSLDFEATLRSVARLAVPRLADWCAVELCVDGGGTEQLAVAHVDPAKVHYAWQLRDRYPPDPSLPYGLHEVIRSGKSELYEEIPEELLVRGARDDEHRRLSLELGLRSALIVPIATPQRTAGAITLVFAESGRRFDRSDLVLAEDLAARAALAVENARLYRDAQRAIEHRDEFLSVASHELKTPLTSLSLHVTGLLRATRADRTTPLTLEKVVERLGKIDGQVGRLALLIDELLDVSRISAGRLALARDDVDLALVAREVLARFHEQAKDVGCALSLAAASAVGRWDKNRLDQVVTNLVSNALKYGAKAPVDVAVEPTAGGARLTVTDRGIGIAPEHQARIFERFERAASARHYGGMGLGLWIVKEIVAAHGGTVRVASEPGAGAAFVVELPGDGSLSR